MKRQLLEHFRAFCAREDRDPQNETLSSTSSKVGRVALVLATMSLLGSRLSAQEQFLDGGEFAGAGSVGSSEPLFYYDEQERWKHGYIQMMPYYHGFHSFRPYNYHHVFSQSSTAQGYGMSPVMPYSQQFWHRYEHMADLSQGNHEPVFPGNPPVKENDHYPKPINDPTEDNGPSAFLMRPAAPQYQYQQGFAPNAQGPLQNQYINNGYPVQPSYNLPPQQTIAPVQYAPPPSQFAPAQGMYPQQGYTQPQQRQAPYSQPTPFQNGPALPPQRPAY